MKHNVLARNVLGSILNKVFFLSKDSVEITGYGLRITGNQATNRQPLKWCGYEKFQQ